MLTCDQIYSPNRTHIHVHKINTDEINSTWLIPVELNQMIVINYLFHQLSRNLLPVNLAKLIGQDQLEAKIGMFLRLSSNGLVMEDEMTLDGAIISASFDEALETVSHKLCNSCLSIVAHSVFVDLLFSVKKCMGDEVSDFGSNVQVPACLRSLLYSHSALLHTAV